MTGDTGNATRAEAAAVLFDLDGTLVDTAPGLAAAANRLRSDQGLPPLDVADYRPYVSRGSRGLVKAALGEGAANRTTLDRFLAYYRADLLHGAGLFPGQGRVLDMLDVRDLPWGVVTNKPSWLSEPLLMELGLLERISCLVCGDQVSRPKPAPEPLLTACCQLGLAPHTVWFVGDALADARAAAGSGVRFLIAAYGYLNAADEPETWSAAGSLDSPEALLAWLAAEATP